MARSKKVLEHPGLHLKGTYLIPLNLTQTAFASHIGVSPSTISRLVQGKISISGELAFLLGKATGTDAVYWLDLQREYELESAKKDKILNSRVKKIKVLPGIENL